MNKVNFCSSILMSLITPASLNYSMGSSSIYLDDIQPSKNYGLKSQSKISENDVLNQVKPLNYFDNKAKKTYALESTGPFLFREQPEARQEKKSTEMRHLLEVKREEDQISEARRFERETRLEEEIRITQLCKEKNLEEVKKLKYLHRTLHELITPLDQELYGRLKNEIDENSKENFENLKTTNISLQDYLKNEKFSSRVEDWDEAEKKAVVRLIIELKIMNKIIQREEKAIRVHQQEKVCLEAEALRVHQQEKVRLEAEALRVRQREKIYIDQLCEKEKNLEEVNSIRAYHNKLQVLITNLNQGSNGFLKNKVYENSTRYFKGLRDNNISLQAYLENKGFSSLAGDHNELGKQAVAKLVIESEIMENILERELY